MPSETDFRDRLANERTYLAWIRTSLGYLAAGIAIAYIGPHREAASKVLSLLAIAAAALIAAGGHLRWTRNNRRLGEGLPPETGRLPAVVTAITLIAAAVAAVLAIVATDEFAAVSR